MADIHPTAIVNPRAEIDETVSVGPYAIIDENVEIGPGCKIGSNVLIGPGARLSKDIAIHHGAVICTVPQDLKFGGEETTVEIGERTVIREYATVNRGTEDRWKTVIGSDCFMMAYSHVAHDCIIGDHVILANSVNLGGHVVIEDWAIVGGIVPVHQFVRIGQHTMIGGGFRVTMDVCPYALVGGYPLKVIDVNHIGLSRRGFSENTVKTLRKAFRIIFRSKLTTAKAFERIESELPDIPEIRTIKRFFETAKRGVIR